MIDKHTRPPGTVLVMSIITMLLLWLGWAAYWRPVRVDRTDPALVQQNWPDMRVNVNTASVAELTLLPGVGPALAQRIVDDRQANGRFESIDDLRRVRGIGSAIVERASAYAVVE